MTILSHELVKVSKTLSYVLRHRPDSIGINLGEAGWVGINDLLERLVNSGHNITRAQLDEVVQGNDKQRFAISEDGLRIRANQGHSVEVDLKLSARVPPDLLFHGTATKSLESIKRQGLMAGRRHHVHLSAAEDVAKTVGARHGKPVVLRIDAKAMHQAGVTFFMSSNGVWLVEHVPSRFILPQESF